jgi:hypothetical protein
MTFRILVTGSRKWADPARVAHELSAAAGDQKAVAVIHGACRTGADVLAEVAARGLGFRTEPHPARWGGPCRPACPPGHRHQRVWQGAWYCPSAGLYRNQEMVDAGADICLAFFWPGAANLGTTDCARRARAAGIPVTDVRP